MNLIPRITAGSLLLLTFLPKSLAEEEQHLLRLEQKRVSVRRQRCLFLITVFKYPLLFSRHSVYLTPG